MTRLLAVVVLAVILSGCLAPEVTFSGPGCGGALVAPEAVVSVAHCFRAQYSPFAMRLPSGLDIYAQPIAWNAGNDLVIMRPILQTGEPLYVYWPWYAEYEAPELLQVATIRGGCPTRVIANYQLVYTGETAVERMPWPIQPGDWPHWIILDGAYACPGDSGYLLLDPTGPHDGAWVYYGLFSTWRGWGFVLDDSEVYGMLVTSTGALSE